MPKLLTFEGGDRVVAELWCIDSISERAMVGATMHRPKQHEKQDQSVRRPEWRRYLDVALLVLMVVF
jgi:hypothetical protein